MFLQAKNFGTICISIKINPPGKLPCARTSENIQTVSLFNNLLHAWPAKLLLPEIYITEEKLVRHSLDEATVTLLPSETDAQK